MIAIDIPVIAACTNKDKCPDGWCTAAACLSVPKSWEQIPMEIDISILKSVSSVTDDEAQKIIAQTAKAMINGKPAKVINKTDSSITIEEPPDPGQAPWFIVFTTEKGETVVSFVYDRKLKKFPPKEEEDQSDPYDEIVKVIGRVAAAIENKNASPTRRSGT
jgi:hypothetical protein